MKTNRFYVLVVALMAVIMACAAYPVTTSASDGSAPPTTPTIPNQCEPGENCNSESVTEVPAMHWEETEFAARKPLSFEDVALGMTICVVLLYSWYEPQEFIVREVIDFTATKPGVDEASEDYLLVESLELVATQPRNQMVATLTIEEPEKLGLTDRFPNLRSFAGNCNQRTNHGTLRVS